MMYDNWGFRNNMADSWYMLFMLFLVLTTIATVFLLMRYFSGRARSLSINETAIAILQKRYAKGEINKSEYEEIKKGLAVTH